MRDQQVPTRLRRPLLTVHRTDPIGEVFSAVVQRGVQLCRVVDGTRTVGVVALDDILRAVVGSAG